MSISLVAPIRYKPSGTTILSQLGSFFLISFLLFSCKKGDIGPAGPTGPAGATGQTGATGSPKVIYSDWFTPTAYPEVTVEGISNFSYDKTVPEITQAILDSGDIVVFGKFFGYDPILWPKGQVAALPISLSYKIGSVFNTDTWSALATPGNLRVRFVSSANQYVGLAPDQSFRYIIIPGGVKASTSFAPGQQQAKGNTISDAQTASIKTVVQNYGQMSYAEICQRLGVPQ